MSKRKALGAAATDPGRDLAQGDSATRAPVTKGPAVIKAFVRIPGWFFWVDRLLFASLLHVQSGSAAGVLVELGAFPGKNAVIIGDFVRPGYRFVALDLFGRTDLLEPGQG